MRLPLAVTVLLATTISQAADKQPSIGLGVASIDFEAAAKTKLPAKIGVLISRVDAGKGGEAAGLQPGDVLFLIDGSPIADIDALKAWLSTTEDGKTYSLTVYRHSDRKWSRRVMPLTITYIAPPPAPDDTTEWKAWEAEQLKLPPDQLPFDIKGDRLSMTLDMFKRKNYRTVQGHDEALPFCSDIRPNIDLSTLFYEATMAKAGIVHGRTNFPFEELGDKPRFATIANVPTQDFIYKFVDGKLYEMIVFINHEHYAHVFGAMKEKFGEPSSVQTKVYQNGFGAKFEGDESTWHNTVSAIAFFERAGKTDRSLLVVSHKQLAAIANARLEATKPKGDL